MIGRVRGTLLLASLGLILVTGAVTALYLRHELGTTVEDRVQSELMGQAGVARIGLESLPVIDGEVGQVAARRFAAATGARLEVVAPDGAVVADSDRSGDGNGPPRRVDLRDPELVAALDAARGRGVDRRGGRILVAVPFDRPGLHGALRVSAPLVDVERAYDHLYALLVVAGAVGLAVSIIMTWLATSLMSRALRRLSKAARDMLRREGRVRVAAESGDDLDELGRTLNRLADDVERLLSALGRERSLLASVLESMSQGVVALDGDRKVTLMNEAACDLLDLPCAPVGSAFLDHVRVPPLVELIQPPFRADSAEVQMPTGSRLVARVAPNRTGDGAILVIQDVTSVRRLETIRRDFVANVSHELRTPVSVIRANAETLLGGALDDPRFANRMVEGLHRNAERLSRILADLLDLSRLEAGQYRYDLKPVPLPAAIDQALSSVETAAATKEIAIEVDLDDALTVQADAKGLDQILVNLVDNAVKYTPARGRVWIAAEARADRVRIEIRDDGAGIAPKHRERIFERFYRVDPGRSRDVGGTGLGLSIVKHLVESMHGTIGVEENRPAGTIFWIELRAGRATSIDPRGNPDGEPDGEPDREPSVARNGGDDAAGRGAISAS